MLLTCQSTFFSLPHSPRLLLVSSTRRVIFCFFSFLAVCSPPSPVSCRHLLHSNAQLTNRYTPLYIVARRPYLIDLYCSLRTIAVRCLLVFGAS
ncbi:hypothetical protein FB451DRAFT_1411347 [Mycena latifolia]|nr:hypothetical protein FB451DRAFT_1411347 [Mycena latifolia]